MDESGLKYSKAERKALAVREIEDLVKKKVKTRDALEQVAFKTGMSIRTLFTCLAKTRGVAIDDREAALERKKAPPKKRLVCHPEALKMFLDMCRDGGSIAECYRQMVAAAKINDWSPILPERTLRRILDEQVSWAERYAARRAKKTNGGK